MRVLITGGAGFIGSALTRRLCREADIAVAVYDKLTYAADLRALEGLDTSGRITFVRGDICDRALFAQTLGAFAPDVVMNLAAESHVDRSIDAADDFIATNVSGVQRVLDACLAHWRALSGAARDRFRLVHMSTDEVFGVAETGAFAADTPYDPRSPYSASKAAGDHLVSAWRHTFGLPAAIVHASNNYGPYQFPEKLIPLMIVRALAREPLPVFGDGLQVRDWLHVEDHAEALARIARTAAPGERYLIGARSDRPNIEIVRAICDLVDEMAGDGGPSRRALITHVQDRPGHDRRYAVDPSFSEARLGWRPARTPEEGLRQTVAWYLANRAWWEPLRSERGAGARLGLARVR
jgi:dTDP-glucose 4,6-dehydratase